MLRIRKIVSKKLLKKQLKKGNACLVFHSRFNAKKVTCKILPSSLPLKCVFYLTIYTPDLSRPFYEH